ncbi:MAG: hypothetical protein QW567_01085 [Candidatus Hadarchaeales archaeon]
MRTWKRKRESAPPSVLIAAIVLAAAAFTALLLIPRPMPGEQPQGGGGETPGGGGQLAASYLYLETAKIVDAERTDLEAFSIIVPSEWEIQGGITWRTDRPLLPASLDFSVSGAEGLRLEVLPDEAYFWVEGYGLLIPYDYGPELRALYAMYYQGYGMSQAMGAGDYISEIVIPRYRHGVTDLRTIDEIPLGESELVSWIENTMAQRPEGPFLEEVTVDAAGLRVRYVENGENVEEEIWTIILVDTFRTTPEMEQTTGARIIETFWYPCGIWSLRSAGELTPENTKLLMSILNSFRWNQNWLDEYARLLTDIWREFLEGIMESHQILTRMQNEVTRIIETTFSNQEAVMERTSEEWSQVIRGVEAYDPEPGLVEFGAVDLPSVELPNGYDYAWTNRLGDYILTDSALFNPNVDLETNYDWVQMAKRG